MLFIKKNFLSTSNFLVFALRSLNLQHMLLGNKNMTANVISIGLLFDLFGLLQYFLSYYTLMMIILSIGCGIKNFSFNFIMVIDNIADKGSNEHTNFDTTTFAIHSCVGYTAFILLTLSSHVDYNSTFICAGVLLLVQVLEMVYISLNNKITKIKFLE
jgi:hypothetical protein